jgi:hypothetical protein
MVGKQNNPRKEHKGVRFERQTERAALPASAPPPATPTIDKTVPAQGHELATDVLGICGVYQNDRFIG